MDLGMSQFSGYPFVNIRREVVCIYKYDFTIVRLFVCILALTKNVHFVPFVSVLNSTKYSGSISGEKPGRFADTRSNRILATLLLSDNV
jgi:hypothetical protein